MGNYIEDSTNPFSGDDPAWKNFADPAQARKLFDFSTKEPFNEVAYKTGQLLQKQFEDWEKTFKPIELQALNQVSLNNANVLPEALTEARKGVSGAYDAMPGVLERQNRGLGIEETEQQKAATKRMINVNKAAATAGAENTARAGVRQMDESILMGATPNPNIAQAKSGVTG